ncbi:hypothetical protein [Actimicrobium antarcticum]|uniref:DUF2231 domain-containing protein n=1 Tax=Actimicrobium antarcticum TaxID=1051899 RepID=A0ABP7TDC9_9BURK
MSDNFRGSPGRHKPPSVTAAVLFDLLNPIPFGFFVGALIFDAVYVSSADVMWFKAAAWLISIGLVFAVIPRFINLAWVWFPGSRRSTVRDKGAFFMVLAGVAAAIVNAFVHSRDAYGIMPEGLLLSILTVALMAAGSVLVALQNSTNDLRVQA